MSDKKLNFKVFIIIYIIIYAGACLYGAFVPSDGNSYERGASIYFPTPDSVLSDTFSVNGSIYAIEGIKQANLILESDNDKLITPIEQEIIMHEGEILETLSTFKNEITIKDGDYEMYIEIIENDNVTNTFPARNIKVRNGVKASAFNMFSTQHLTHA